MAGLFYGLRLITFDKNAANSDLGNSVFVRKVLLLKPLVRLLNTRTLIGLYAQWVEGTSVNPIVPTPFKSYALSIMEAISVLVIEAFGLNVPSLYPLMILFV
jgi:hypothetical protein